MITYRDLGRRGRLGNALFELASTIGIARTYNQDVIFPEDWMHRPYFSVPDEMFGPIPDCAVEAYDMIDAVGHIDPRVRAYLQDINLFWPHIDEIRGYLRPSETAWNILDDHQYEMPGGTLTAVHVRRGDNVYDPGVPNKSDYHTCPTLDYYCRGLSQFSNEHISVFSDDIAWCREFLGFADYFGDGRGYWKEHEDRFEIDAPHDWIDIFQMSFCNQFVISGSTFGIWGALLANVLDDHVVRPDKVYGPLLSYIDESLLYPPGWKVNPLAVGPE
jgi:hypothetical protein